MNKAAYDAIEKIWYLTMKVRARCPSSTDLMIGATGYRTAPWYQAHGIDLEVIFPKPLTKQDIDDLNKMGEFVNRSFIINMVATLEEFGILPKNTPPDISKNGGKLVKLAKLYRNHFAHGDWEFDPDDPDHQKTRAFLEKELPIGASKGPGFVISIDTVLEPLKDGVLEYIRATT